MVGTTVSHYRILEKLGGGGMGLVFKAEDIRLGRTVALKFLPPELTRDEDAKERFLREAQAASALDHPNLCTVYQVDTTPDGQLFIAMSFYEGETLRDKIARGPLSSEEATKYIRQVATGLARAHRSGILHRDIKPANLHITPDGEVKILDFGLAKIADQSALTHTGSSLGTPMYMAPEQISGHAGPRSDVFALGIVAYEMLAGERPFRGDGTAVLYGILHHEAEPLSEHRGGLPREILHLVDSMLEKDPDRRPAAAEVARYLDPGSPGSTTLTVPIPRWRRRPSGFLPALAAVALLGILALAVGAFRDRARPPSLTHGDHSAADTIVAVLPFAFHGSAELAYLGEGMVDVLSTKLDGAGELCSVDPRALLGAVSINTRGKLDPPNAQQVANRFGAGRFILGNVFELAGKIRLDATLYTVPDDTSDVSRPLVRAEVEGEASEILMLVDELATQLLASQMGSAALADVARLPDVTTASLPALKAYLEAESAFRDSRFQDAKDALRRALAEDPEFALAWYRLSLVGEWLLDLETVREGARQAALHADRLSDHHRQLVDALFASEAGDFTGARASYRELLQRHPEDVETWLRLGELEFHCGPLHGRTLSDSTPVWESLLDLDPAHQQGLLHLARIAYAERDLDRIESLTEGLATQMGDGERAPELLAYRSALPGEAGREASEQLRAILEQMNGLQPEWGILAGYLWSTDRRALDTLDNHAQLLLAAGRSAPERALGHRILAIAEAARGRFRDAFDNFEASAALHPPYANELAPLLLTLPFLPTDGEALGLQLETTAASLAPSSDAQPIATPRFVVEPHQPLQAHLRAYQLGLLAARRGDTGAARSHAAALETLGGAFGTAYLGDDLARGIRARLAWEAGEPDATLAEITTLSGECHYQIAIVSPLASHSAERFLRAESLIALGRDREALAWLETLPQMGVFDLVYLAPATQRKAEILHRLGEPEAARHELERFLAIWSDADPELQPKVEDARRLLDTLGLG